MKRGSWSLRLTVLAALAVHGAIAHDLAVVMGLAALTLGSSLSRNGIVADRLAQLMLVLAALVGSWYYPSLVGAPADLAVLTEPGPMARAFGMAALIIAVARLWLRAPWQGDRVTVVAAGLAVLANGAGKSTAVYAALLLPFLASSGLALRAADPGRPKLSASTPRHRRMLAGGLLVAALLAAGLAVALPPLHDWTLAHTGFSWERRATGFDTTFALGSLHDLQKSDAIVMRITGPRPDYLRGEVYTRYRRGNWFGSNRSVFRRLAPPSSPAAPDDDRQRTRIRTTGGDTSRYFLPLDSRAIAGGGDLESEPLGVVRPVRGETATTISFVRGPRDRASSAGPDAEDVDLPPDVAPALREIATRWTAGATDAEDRLQRLESHLRGEASYSLEFHRRPGVDPVLDFLTREKRGHCEYFASALALLARSVNVPARVVGGYIVGGHNSLGGYHVVRQRHAHAWVEAWLGPARGWSTRDATPAEARPGAGHIEEVGTAAALGDLLRAWLGDRIDDLGRLTPLQIADAVAALLLVWLSVRLVRRIRLRRRDRRSVLPGQYSDPPAFFAALLRRLQERGVPRAPGEPLETYAERLRRAPELGADAEATADLLLAYAGWRYGGKGDGTEIERTAARMGGG